MNVCLLYVRNTVKNTFIARFALKGAFDDDDVIHVEDDVNPVRDLEIISEELRKKVFDELTELCKY